MAEILAFPSALRARRAARRRCDARGGILLGALLATPDQLAARLLAEAGEPRPILSPLAERLLAARAAADAGGRLAGARPGDGLADAVHRTLDELRRAEVGPADLRRAAATLGGAPGARLRSTADALESYEGRLAALRLLDRAGAAGAAAAAVRAGARFLDGAPIERLEVEGFASLSRGEVALLAALAARADSAVVRVPSFADGPRVAPAVDRLARLLEADEALGAHPAFTLEHERVADDGRSAAPRAVLGAFVGAPEPPGGGRAAPRGTVRAVAGAGEEDEAAAVAREAALLVGAGVPPDEIAIVSTAARHAAPALAAALRDEGLPFATGRGAPLATAPPARAFLDLLGAAAAGLDDRTASRLAGSPYLGLRVGPAELAARLSRSGALPGRRAPSEALRLRAAALGGEGGRRERSALARASEEVAELERLARSLGEPARPARHAARLGRAIDASGARRRAARAEPAVAARDVAALERLVEAAEGLAQALVLVGRGDEEVPPAEWSALLSVAAGAATLPPPLEPAVAVELWDAAEVAGLSTRAAIVCGAERGALPAPAPPDPILRDPERVAVNAILRRHALATSGDRRAEALHRAATALAVGREALVVAWAGDGPAGPGEPSPEVAAALAAALGPVGARPPPRAATTLPEARTEPEALRAAVRWAAGAGEGAAVLSVLPAGLAARAESALARGRIEVDRLADFDAGRAGRHGGLVDGAGLALAATRLPAEWSATSLETLARCPFRLFLSRVVGLPDAEPGGLDIDPRDEGSLLHAILERFVGGRIARGDWPPSGSRADLAEARAAAAGVLSRFEAEGRVGDPAAWAARREALLLLLDRNVAAEGRLSDGLAPVRVELAFGGRSGRPPLALGGAGAPGGPVLVQGRIHRIDAGEGRLRVVDYKGGRLSTAHRDMLRPERFAVDAFQAPLYMLAAARELPGLALEATIRTLRDAGMARPVPWIPDEAALAGSVAGLVEGARAGRFPVRAGECERCAHGAVCRVAGREPADREEEG